MANGPFSRFGARLLAVFLLAGCARDATAPDSPTGATPPEPPSALFGLLPVRGVTRSTPLATDISVSAVIGKQGGTITIPEAGLTLVVPPNAVSSDVKFTATALAGRAVAYDFQPHGTKFAVPLTFQQDLRKTSLLPTLTAPLLDGAYFAAFVRAGAVLGGFVGAKRASASARCAALSKRASRFFSSARMTVAESAAGMFGSRSASGRA